MRAAVWFLWHKRRTLKTLPLNSDMVFTWALNGRQYPTNKQRCTTLEWTVSKWHTFPYTTINTVPSTKLCWIATQKVTQSLQYIGHILMSWSRPFTQAETHAQEREEVPSTEHNKAFNHSLCICVFDLIIEKLTSARLTKRPWEGHIHPDRGSSFHMLPSYSLTNHPFPFKLKYTEADKFPPEKSLGRHQLLHCLCPNKQLIQSFHSRHLRHTCTSLNNQNIQNNR